MVTNGHLVYKYEDGIVKCVSIMFLENNQANWCDHSVLSLNTKGYEEYAKPKPKKLTGWERVGENESYYSINGNSYVEEMTPPEDMCMEDKYYYEDANYSQQKKKQRRSTSNKHYSVSYNVLVMRMVVMRLVGKKLTRENMEFGTMPTTVKSKSVVLGQFEISVKSTSSQKK